MNDENDISSSMESSGCAFQDRADPKVGPIVSSCSLKRKRPPKIEIPQVLREIHIEPDPGFREFGGSQRDGFGLSYSGSGFGVYSLKGRKKFMEDAHKIVSRSEEKKCFFGVYDGHGGSKAAEFVAENLHANIFEMLENSSENMKKEEAVKAGYLKTDQQFLKQGLGSGACCVTALVEGKDLLISNLGDCRAVLSRGGIAQALTIDHRAGEEKERRRIEDAGGFAVIHRGAWRVHGVLSVSRSIGDAHLKNWLLAEPETSIMSLTHDMEYLILASDGLWEEVSNQEAVDIVKKACSLDKISQVKVLSFEDNGDDSCELKSPLPKLQRISLLKSIKTSPSTHRKKSNDSIFKENEDIFGSENESPPAKAPRFSIRNMKVRSPSSNQENGFLHPKEISCGLEGACRELVNLAVRRGSLDDITVMVIDLNRFKE